ncbi:MAG: hypothetical protein GHCLOJNM_01583 [bacterium]|nr:hypothetical protein [bacterium]
MSWRSRIGWAVAGAAAWALLNQAFSVKLGGGGIRLGLRDRTPLAVTFPIRDAEGDALMRMTFKGARLGDVEDVVRERLPAPASAEGATSAER